MSIQISSVIIPMSYSPKPIIIANKELMNVYNDHKIFLTFYNLFSNGPPENVV